MRMPSDPVSVTTTTATGKPTATNGPISSLILPSSLVPYIWPSSPASFCTGVVVGLLVAFLRPMIEFYVDIGASYISIAMRYILIWGSVAFIAWAILRTLQQTSAATLVINPENEKYNQEQFLGSPNISNDQEFHSSFLKQKQQQVAPQAPMHLPNPPSPRRQLLPYQSHHSDNEELISDQPPILQMYDDEPEIEYVYERSRPGSAYSNSSSNHGRALNGQYIPSSDCVYSDLTSSSGGNYYNPPVSQYNPYRKSPSPKLSNNRFIANDKNTNTASARINSAQQTRVAPSQVSGRTSPTRRVVQSTFPAQPATATVNSSYASTSPVRSSARMNPASTSPVRKPIASNRPETIIHTGIEPKIVSLDDDDGMGTQNAYRGYPNKIHQAHNIYGGGNSLPHAEGFSVLEKPAGQSAFRMKRRP